MGPPARQPGRSRREHGRRRRRESGERSHPLRPCRARVRKVVGAAVIGLSCNKASPLSKLADVAVELLVGGEIVAGSSRLNAGTAQKIALNTISTSVMVLWGKTYGNLMVDLRATNEKLRDRAVRIVTAVTHVGPERAREALEAASWNTKLACLVAASGEDAAVLAPILEAANGRLRTRSTCFANPACWQIPQDKARRPVSRSAQAHLGGGSALAPLSLMAFSSLVTSLSRAARSLRSACPAKAAALQCRGWSTSR